MSQKSIEVRLGDGKKVSALCGDFEIRTDQSVDNGGGASAPEPFDLFLTSLGTCAGVFVAAFCQERDIPTDRIRLVQTWSRGEKRKLTGIRLGIGVIAVAGAVLYLLFGVVNWRDYQEKVDWGVVWLYAGAIIFGRTLDSTGAAYWMARSVVEAMASLGMASGQTLLALGGGVTALLTNLMADGPAAAAVGPITLNMAAISSPGTTLIPFMGLITAASSSFAYMLVIGTPPNAIVYASGFLGPKDFLRVGLPCFIASFGVLMLLSWLYWPLIGYPGLNPM